MAIIDSNQTVSANRSGFEKGIQRSANMMILDNLQTFMYQKPIQSAVRECVSNAVDSVKEKNVAIKILKGEAKVEDFYISKESVADKIASADSDIYEDSEFNRDYYDLKWLSLDDIVTVTYKSNEQSKRDEFIISDNGVGLGGARLEGFFNLGYSSKRLNTNELGGFGLGAKSPLSTGVESYRIVSRYNGKEFCFDIYSHKVDCVYSKWNDDGTTNKFYEFHSVMVKEDYTDEEGNSTVREVPYKAYYKDTYEKNSVTLSIEVRKHNRMQYFEAVKSQLMYLKDNIIFKEESYMGTSQIVNFKANILYEDDNIIMSDYNYYQKPHFVIKNVGYGLIDFAELDLSPKFGNIGIKVKMEEINVTPSRETVIYSTKTRDAVLKQYDKVSDTVQEKIEEALDQEKLLDWVRACNKIMYSSNSSNDIIARLSSLIEKSSLKPKFKNANIEFNSDVKQFITPIFSMTHRVLTETYDYSKSKKVKKLNTNEVDSIISFDKPIYVQFEAGNGRVTKYLSAIHYKDGGFCSIRVAKGFIYLEEIFDDYVRNKISKQEFLNRVDAALVENEDDAKRLSNVREMIKKTVVFLDALLGSGVTRYTESIVPDDFKATDDAEEDDSDGEVDVDIEANEEAARKKAYAETLKRRKENKVFIANVMINKRKTAYSFEGGFLRTEVKSSSLDYDNTKILYGTEDDSKVFDLLMEFERATPNARTNETRNFYWNDDIKILKVAKSNLRYVKEAAPVRDYVINVDNNGVLRACSKIKDMFTADAIINVLGTKCSFMRNFREFSGEITDTYDKLTAFVQKQASIGSFDGFKDYDVVQTLQAAYKVQLELLKHSSITEDERQDIIDANVPTTLDFDIIDIDLIDVKLYNDALKLVAFSDVYGSILSYIEPLQARHMPILKPDLVIEIKSIIDSRKDQLEFKYENIN